MKFSRQLTTQMHILKKITKIFCFQTLRYELLGKLGLMGKKIRTFVGGGGGIFQNFFIFLLKFS